MFTSLDLHGPNDFITLAIRVNTQQDFQQQGLSQQESQTTLHALEFDDLRLISQLELQITFVLRVFDSLLRSSQVKKTRLSLLLIKLTRWPEAVKGEGCIMSMMLLSLIVSLCNILYNSTSIYAHALPQSRMDQIPSTQIYCVFMFPLYLSLLLGYNIVLLFDSHYICFGPLVNETCWMKLKFLVETLYSLH